MIPLAIRVRSLPIEGHRLPFAVEPKGLVRILQARQYVPSVELSLVGHECQNRNNENRRAVILIPTSGSAMPLQVVYPETRAVRQTSSELRCSGLLNSGCCRENQLMFKSRRAEKACLDRMIRSTLRQPCELSRSLRCMCVRA